MTGIRRRTVVLGGAAFPFVLVGAGSGDPAGAEDAYAPLYPRAVAPQAMQARQARGTLKGDFDRCAESRSLAEATPSWEEFLETWDPADGEFEDGFHALHVRVAKLELARAYYLLDRSQEADRLLRELDPLDLR